MIDLRKTTKLKEIIVAVENGDADSQAYLACAYFEGKIVKKNNREACFWGQCYLQNEIHNSQYDCYVFYILGVLTFEGKVTVPNRDDARELLEKSYAGGFERV